METHQTTATQTSPANDITLFDLTRLDMLLAQYGEILKDAKKYWKLYTRKEQETLIAAFDEIEELSNEFEVKKEGKK